MLFLIQYVQGGETKNRIIVADSVAQAADFILSPCGRPDKILESQITDIYIKSVEVIDFGSHTVGVCSVCGAVLSVDLLLKLRGDILQEALAEPNRVMGGCPSCGGLCYPP